MMSSTPACASAELLSVEGLYIGDGAGNPIVEDLSFTIAKGEALAIVGESGCGKSLTSLAVMGLLPANLEKSRRGVIRFEGKDLTKASEKELQALRGNRMAMVFQEPLTALNPLLTLGTQISEVLRQHKKLSKAEAKARAIALLEMVRLPDPEKRYNEHPHRLSGGQRQRVTIAMAMACDPALIIADEPTTALDVTVQAQILALMAELRAKSGQSLMLITHDLGVVGQVADRMVVVYAGQIVESGPVAEVLRAPRHPYTKGLMLARPHGSYAATGIEVTDIPGAVPAPSARPKGCLFAPRCAFAQERCQSERPVLSAAEGKGQYACFHPLEV